MGGVKGPAPFAVKVWDSWLIATGGVMLCYALATALGTIAGQVVTLGLLTMLTGAFLIVEIPAAVWAPQYTLSWRVSIMSWPWRYGLAAVLPIIAGVTVAAWPIWPDVVVLETSLSNIIGVAVWFPLAAWLVGHFPSRMKII